MSNSVGRSTGVWKNGRGQGKTSDAMRTAPEGAVYIWCNANISYAQALAGFLGRRDLRIMSPMVLETSALRGMDCTVVIDHALFEQMTPRQRAGYQQLLEMDHG